MLPPLDFIKKTIATADGWQKKKELTWVQRCVDGALMDYYKYAVRQSGIADAVAWLLEHRVDALLDRSCGNLRHVIDQVDAGRWPGSVLGGNYRLIINSHFAWSLGLHDLGECLLRVSRRNDVLEISTPFWNEYSLGLEALVENTPYTAADTFRNGREENWAAYLTLISAASVGRPLESAIHEIDDQFVRRNRVGPIENDPYGIEGSSQEPVSWDFRRDSLLAYILRAR